MNDCVSVSPALQFILFADDTNVFFSHQSQMVLERRINDELEKLAGWFKTNKLSLNVKKKHFIIFTTRQERHNFVIKMGGDELVQVQHTKFLGITTDEDLNWGSHTSLPKIG